jgi:hypothetical protein
MCAERPLLLAAPPDNLASRIVRRANAGIATSANTTDFLEGANQLLSDKPRLPQYSANARAYAERNFSIDSICDEFLEVVTYTFNGRREAQTAVLPLPVSRATASVRQTHKSRGARNKQFIN